MLSGKATTINADGDEHEVATVKVSIRVGTKEIKEALEQTAYESIVYVGVETLEYLKKGGRVTPAGAAMGTLLSIKPLLVIAGERLDAYAKVRGTKSCKKRLLMEMKTIADEFHKNSDDILYFHYVILNISHVLYQIKILHY